MKKSIYGLILENIEDGKLKEGFSLDMEESDGVKFADGAMDGIFIYHMNKERMDAAGTKKMINALKRCSAGDFEGADEQLSELGANYRAISVIDDFQKYILSHGRRIGEGVLYDFAKYLIHNSADCESVKFGMEIMELFRPDESDKTTIRRLGLSDEFTIFAVWNMLRSWDNANEEVFDLAKKVRGWGRIHALERLEASTPEISEWVLLHGADNDVSPEYSALTVWNKASVPRRLKGTLTEEEFGAVSRIIAALLREGPVAGISEIEEPEEALLDFVDRARESCLNIDAYETLFALDTWASFDESGIPSVAAACSDLLSTDECRETVEQAVKRGEGLELAESLGIDYAENFFECFTSDFDGQYMKASYLTCFEDYLEPVIELFRENLPLEEMRAEPTDEMCPGPSFERYDKLCAINYALAEYPNEGEDLLIAGLHSPGVRMRNAALGTAEEWVRRTMTPLEYLSPLLYAELEEVTEKEVDASLENRMRVLLNGQIPADPGEDEADEDDVWDEDEDEDEDEDNG